MAKGAYIGVDGVARKIKKGYIGIQDKTVHFDGVMHHDGSNWVSDRSATWSNTGTTPSAHVEFEGVLYKNVTMESMDSGGARFSYLSIPDTNLEVEINSNGECLLYDNGDELDKTRTYSVKVYTGTLESVAHKIKKAYIGVGGVARPCWSGGEEV